VSATVLVLNTTFEPLNEIGLHRAVKLLLNNKAKVVRHHEKRQVRAETIAFPMPSIIQMLYYIKRNHPKKVAMTKKNVLLRDDHRCQYCGVRGERFLTVDHVVPRSRGGPSTFENLVCACQPCNTRKKNRTPGEANMKLLRAPYVPKYIPFVVIERNMAPEDWIKALTLWNVSIEDRIG
jgi:5-methylcytosine-specific restriction endonuclease McrA